MSNGAGTLIVFPGALGDLICLLPALGWLEGRESPLSILCDSRFAEVLRGSRATQDALEGEKSAWLFSSTPPEEADAFFGSFGEILCFTGSRVPEVRSNLARWGGRAFPFRPGKPVHLAQHFLDCVGAASDVPLRVTLPDRNGVAREGADWRRLEGLNTAPLLVVHPGSGGDRKRWSEEGFREIARRWRRRGGEVRVLLGPAEAGEHDRWKPYGVVREPSLRRVASVLASCDVYLGNDSGVSHLAAASGANGLALFGPTDPELWRPLSPAVGVVRISPWSDRIAAPPTEVISVVDRMLAGLSAREVS